MSSVKSPQQHRTDAITAPLPVLTTSDGTPIEMRPLSLGSLNLLQRVGNALFTAESEQQLDDTATFSAAIEAIYILAGPLDEVRRACFGSRSDFEYSVQLFVETLDLENIAEVMDAISAQQAAADASMVEPRPEETDQDTDPNVSGQSGEQDS